jgi:hypothetical protein
MPEDCFPLAVELKGVRFTLGKHEDVVRLLLTLVRAQQITVEQAMTCFVFEVLRREIDMPRIPGNVTHTYVTLEVSAATYKEIADKLREAGYDHAFGDEGEIDMHGIALVREAQLTLLQEMAAETDEPTGA